MGVTALGVILKALLNQNEQQARAVFGRKDITTSAMQEATREWFSLYFLRKPTKEENPNQRLPFAITSKLQKATFAEYDSGIVSKHESGKAAWMDSNRIALDKIKQTALLWTMVGGEGFIKPVPCGAGFAYVFIRRDRYSVLGRASDGTINDMSTTEYTLSDGVHYTLFERRTVDNDGFLTVENKLFASASANSVGKQVSLASLPQYANLPAVHTYQRPLGGVGMAYIKMPTANSVDGSEDGMSIYEPAVQLIHDIYKNEHQLGKELGKELDNGQSRIMASSEMLKTYGPSGNKLKLKDDVFVSMDGPVSSIPITTFSPALRNQNFEQRKQSYLKSCETLIGLKHGILSDVEAVERTATEVTSSVGEYSMSIIDLQRMWYDALRETLRISEVWGQMFGLCDARPFDFASELTVKWGNGVLYDARQDFMDNLTMVQAGILKPEIAIAQKNDLAWDTPEAIQVIRDKYMPELTAALEVKNNDA